MVSVLSIAWLRSTGLHFRRTRVRELLHGLYDGGHALHAFAGLLDGSRNLVVQICEIRFLGGLARLLHRFRQHAGAFRPLRPACRNW